MRRGKNCNCGCRVPAAVSTIGINRGMKFHSVLSSEFGTDTVDWFDSSYTGNFSGGYAFSTRRQPNPLKYLWIDWYSATDFNSGAPNYDQGWIKKMKPVRYELGIGVGSNDFSYFPHKFILESDPHEFGFISSMPPTGSHVLPMQLKYINMTFPPFVHNSFYYLGCKIYKYRILVNGVDVTGVRDVSYDMSYNSDPQSYTALYASASISLVNNNVFLTGGETIYIDFWTQYTIKKINTVGGPPNPYYVLVGGLSETTDYFRGWRTAYTGLTRIWGYLSLDYVNYNAQRYQGDKYQINFSNNGPAGLSSIILEPQSDWDYYEDPGGVYMYHYSTNDAVSFIWGSEVPYVVVNIAAKYNSPPSSSYYTGEVRYFPQPNNTYDTIKVAGGSSGYVTYGYGTWDAQGSTNFLIQGRKKSHWIGNSYSGYSWETMPPTSTYTSLRAGFPTTVTVERL